MALPALKQAMDEITIFPPAFRFAEAMELVKTSQDLTRLLPNADRDITIWRNSLLRNTREGFKRMEAAAGDLPKPVYAPLMINFIDQSLSIARKDLQAFVEPYSELPEVVSMRARVAGQIGQGPRTVRKLIDLVDSMQAKHRDSYLFMIGVLREYRSRYEPYVGDGPNGPNRAAYLRSLNDRYLVVNAKLAQ